MNAVENVKHDTAIMWVQFAVANITRAIGAHPCRATHASCPLATLGVLRTGRSSGSIVTGPTAASRC